MTSASRVIACSIAIACLVGGRSAEAATEGSAPPRGPSVASDGAAPDSSESGGFQLGWEATYASWYSFQGLDYSGRRPVFQPELRATMKGASIGAWGNIDHSRGELNEVDVTLQWGWEGNRASGGLGYVNLQYPHRPDWEPSQEVFGEVALEAPFEPSASVHWDVDKGHGRYWELGFGHEILVPSAAILLAAALYVQDDYYGMTGISAVETRVGIRRVWGGIAWEPSLARLWSWENGDFQGPDAVAPGWLLSLSLSPP